MMKYILLTLTLSVSTLVQASALSDANQKVIDECGKAGGKMTSFKAGDCEYQRCIYNDNKSDGKFYRSGDNKKQTCSDEDLAKAIDKAQQEIRDAIASKNPPKPAEQNQNGNGSGNGNGDFSDKKLYCEPAGVTLIQDGLCWNKCKRQRLGGALDRGVCEGVGKICDSSNGNLCGAPSKNLKADNGWYYQKQPCPGCLDCLIANKNDLRINVDLNSIPRNPKDNSIAGKKTVDLEGVTSMDSLWCIETSGTSVNMGRAEGCPSGSQVDTTRGRGGKGGGSGNGSGSNGRVVTVGGVTGGNGNGSGSNGRVIINTGTSRDNGRTVRIDCTSAGNEDDCTGGESVRIRERILTGDDCPTCGSRYRQDSVGSQIAQVAGAVLPSLAAFGIGWLQTDASIKNNQAWANAQVATAEQCRLGQQSYYNNITSQISTYQNYTVTNGISEVTPEIQNSLMGHTQNGPQCNGYPLGAYSGFNNIGGNWMNGGYSPGFIAGMNGPYFPGYQNGFNSGWGNNNMACYQGMCGNNGGWGMNNGGMGMVNGISLAGGVNGGWGNNGWNNGMINNGWNNGMINNGWNNGMINNGWNNGMNTGWGNNGWNTGWGNGGANGWNNGGWNNGNSYWNNTMGNPQQDWMYSNQASNRDRAFQQNGMNYQMGNMSNSFGGWNTGMAGYQPSNMGFNMNASLGFGF